MPMSSFLGLLCIQRFSKLQADFFDLLPKQEVGFGKFVFFSRFRLAPGCLKFRVKV